MKLANDGARPIIYSELITQVGIILDLESRSLTNNGRIYHQFFKGAIISYTTEVAII
jgi:hypothetical protein